MDDPLRPKIIPLSAETILWFEFLLDPPLLLTHLTKPNPDPNAIELISQFLVIPTENYTRKDVLTPDSEPTVPKPDSFNMGRKQLSVKVLILKVAAFSKWNLDLFERSLSLQKQFQLLTELCIVTSGKVVKLPFSHIDVQIGPKGDQSGFNFALTLYYRWLLRAQVFRELAPKAIKPGFNHVMVTPEQMTSRDDVFLHELEPFMKASIEFLVQICNSSEPFKVPTFDSFRVPLSNEDIDVLDMEKSVTISNTELKCQIHFDLCIFYLYSKKYTLARENVIQSRDCLAKLKEEYKSDGPFHFCSVKEEDLNGYLIACGVVKSDMDLYVQLNNSIRQNFSAVVDILKEDNVTKEISMVNRKILELDVEGSMTHKKTALPAALLNDVAALNIVRSILDDNAAFNLCSFLKRESLDLTESLTKAIKHTLEKGTETDKQKLKEYFNNYLLATKIPNELLQLVKETKLLSDTELTELQEKRNEEQFGFTQIEPLSDWKSGDQKGEIPRLVVGYLERKLIACNTANGVRKLLVKLAGTNPVKPLWQINPRWQLPDTVKAVLMSLQPGFLQDFSCILIGKSRELLLKKDYTTAVALLTVIVGETQRPEMTVHPAVGRLGKLVKWEILLIQIQQAFDEWPKKTTDMQKLVIQCKECLAAYHSGGGDMPRMEILEHCVMMLLNLNDWTTFQMPIKRLAIFDLASGFATAILDVEKFTKGNKRISKEAWDLVLPMFSYSSMRRPNSGGSSRDSPVIPLNISMNAFIKKLRDRSCISIVLSLLSRFLNILKDDSNLDLNAEFMIIWPTTISNANGYNSRAVSETLRSLIQQSLIYYPNYIPWIKLNGDFEMMSGNYEAAMRQYVSALIICTDYCTSPIQKQLIDDYTIKRMIKCSNQLGCYIQAAVLCQYLDEIDYGLAFKNISEKATNFADATDAFYNCIWDSTILEYIANIHYKKGEHKRKLQAISLMGQLELNANNSDEVKKEASSIRNNKFLRALTHQYML